MRKIFTCLTFLFALFEFTVKSEVAAQARIVGRFRIQNPNGKFYGKKKRIDFDAGFKGNYHCNIRKKDSGYFSFKIPVGFSYLTRIHYYDQGGKYIKKLRGSNAALMLDSGMRVYYVGDIIATWDIQSIDEQEFPVYSVMFGLVGGLIDAAKEHVRDQQRQGLANGIHVTVNPATIGRFARKLGIDSNKIVVAPLHPK